MQRHAQAVACISMRWPVRVPRVLIGQWVCCATRSSATCFSWAVRLSVETASPSMLVKRTSVNCDRLRCIINVLSTRVVDIVHLRPFALVTLLLLAALPGLIVAGCGGGSSSKNNPPPPPPPVVVGLDARPGQRYLCGARARAAVGTIDSVECVPEFAQHQRRQRKYWSSLLLDPRWFVLRKERVRVDGHSIRTMQPVSLTTVFRTCRARCSHPRQ